MGNVMKKLSMYVLEKMGEGYTVSGCVHTPNGFVDAVVSNGFASAKYRFRIGESVTIIY